MSEQEPLNSILGFDAVTGMRLDDNVGELRSIERAVPPEIQTAFIEWAKSRPYTKDQMVRISPEHLFLAINGEYYVTRLYYTWNQSLSPEEQTFPRHTQASFVESVLDQNHKYEPFLVHYFDEHDKDGHDRNSISLRYNYLAFDSIILLGVHVWLVKDGRTLYVEDIENVSEVRFTEQDEKQDIFELGLAREGYFKLNGGVLVLGNHPYPRTLIHNPNYLVEENDDKVLIHHETPIFVDTVEILRGKKELSVLDKLFEDAILDDPFSTPCEFDDSWRLADIREITGIKWDVDETPEPVHTTLTPTITREAVVPTAKVQKGNLFRRIFKIRNNLR